MTQEVTPSQAARDAAADYLRQYNETRRGGFAVDGPDLLVQAFARFEEQTRTATEREIREIANSIEVQAGCLERYAESSGFDEKPVPSVFHFQATHFRDLASKLRALSEQKA